SDPPELKIVNRKGDWLAADALPIHDYEKNKAKDYQLVWSPSQYSKDEERFYIVSPKDIVVASPCTIEDHIKWLKDKGRFDEAWQQALAHSETLKLRRRIDPINVGEEYLSSIFNKIVATPKGPANNTNGNDTNDASDTEREKLKQKFGEVCQQVLRDDKARWEKWALAVISQKQLPLIISVLPTANPQLSQSIYQKILNQLMYSAPKFFLNLREKLALFHLSYQQRYSGCFGGHQRTKAKS
ncbi:hypothetical protein RFI_17560, partial [Reticulomyxa filosa]